MSAQQLREKALIFDSDVVFRANNPYIYGLVGDLGWERGTDTDDEDENADVGNEDGRSDEDADADYDADSPEEGLDENDNFYEGDYEEDYEEDMDDFELPLEYDEVEVDFGSDIPEAVHHEQLQVYTRNLQPGHFCSPEDDRLGRSGMVVNTRTMYDLVFEYHAKKKRLPKAKAFKRNILMPSVPGWLLRRIYNILHRDMYAVTTDNTKVATVLGETYRYYVALGPGQLMYFTQPDLELIDPVHEAGFKPILREEEYVLFPGQIVAVSKKAIKSNFSTFVQGSALQAAKLWKRGQDTVRGIIVRVEPVAADVQLLTALDPRAMTEPVAELPTSELRDLCPYPELDIMLHEVVHVNGEVAAAFPHFYAGDDEREWKEVFDQYEQVSYPRDVLQGPPPLRAEDVILRGADGRVGYVGTGVLADSTEVLAQSLARVRAGDGDGKDADEDKEEKEEGDEEEGAGKKGKPVEKMNLCWKYGCARVYRYRSFVDVLWEDGTVQRDIPTRSLVPRLDIGLEDHEHCCNDLVEEREGDASVPRRMGVVTRVDHKEKTCFVRFLYLLDDGAAPRTTAVAELTGQQSEAVPSITALGLAPGALGGGAVRDVNGAVIAQDDNAEASASAGDGEIVQLHHAVITSHGAPAPRDLVLRGIDPVTSLASMRASDVPVGAEILEDDIGRKYVSLPEEEVSAYSLRVCEPIINTGDTVMRFLQEREGETLESKAQRQWVGAVLTLTGGLVTVRWADGSVSRVWHRELFVLNAEADDVAENVDEEGDVLSEDEDYEVLTADADADADAAPESPAAAAAAAGGGAGGGVDAAAPADATAPTVAAVQASDDAAATQSPAPAELPPREVALPADAVCSSWLHTPAFEVLPTVPASHHFLSSQPATSSALGKRLRAEMRQLARDLPPGILARTYAERMDLWSVLIVGPRDTPYHNALFAFEFRLPANYPHEPPIAHFLSGGARTHPNLYEDGKVCLSLLGTWSGKGSQNWTDNSTLLQLFVSLQALVLGIAEPYYCEAGYESKRGSRAAALASLLYNEQALLATTRLFARMVEAPLEPWVGAVHEHAQRVETNLKKLLACKFDEKPHVPCARDVAKEHLGHAPDAAEDKEGGNEDREQQVEEELLECTNAVIMSQRASLSPDTREEMTIIADYALPPRSEGGAWAAEVLSGELYYPSRGFVLQFKTLAKKLKDAMDEMRNHPCYKPI